MISSIFRKRKEKRKKKRKVVQKARSPRFDRKEDTQFVLEFVPVNYSDDGRLQIGDSLFLSVTLATQVAQCAEWIAKQLRTNGDVDYNTNILKIGLGDFGTHTILWGDRCLNKKPNIPSPSNIEIPAVISDFLCHDRPILVKLEDPRKCMSLQVFVKTLTGKTIQTRVTATFTIPVYLTVT